MPITNVTQIAGCQLSLDSTVAGSIVSSGGRVSQWTDQSGLGNHLTQPTGSLQPYLNSGKVSFGQNIAGSSATIPQLIIPSGVPFNNRSATVAMVVNLNAVEPGNFGIVYAFDSPGNYMWVSGKALNVNAGAPHAISAGSPVPTGRAIIIMIVGTSTTDVYINNTHYSGFGIPNTGTRSGNAFLGSSVNISTTSASPAAFDAFAVWNIPFTAQNISDLQAFWEAEFGITPSPSRRLTIDGDSIGYGLYGNGAGTGYAVTNNGWAASMSPPAAVQTVNLAIAGQTLATMITNQGVCSNPLATAGGVTNSAIMEQGGTNDIIGGANAATLYSRQMTYCSAAHTAGYGKVCVFSIISRASIEAVRQANRTQLLTDFSVATPHPRIWLPTAGTTYADLFLDIGNNPIFSASNSYLNTTYYAADATHLTGQGSAIYAQDAASAVNWLFNIASTIVGPTTGTAGVASSAFTHALEYQAQFTGYETITLTASSGTITATSAGGTITGNGTGTVLVTPVYGQNGFTFTYTPSVAGASTISYTNTNGWTNPAANSYTATPGATAPVITSPSTATGTVGVFFSYSTIANNNPTSFSQTGALPLGLSLNTVTGVISGVPAVLGTKTATINAANSLGTGTLALTFTIAAYSAPNDPVTSTKGYFSPAGNSPVPSDTEVTSLQKINALTLLWATNNGKTPSTYFPGGVAPSPGDTEVRSLQKINACLYAISGG